MKNNKAVTLVALIITVIILLILAGVVIAMTIGDEGIINKSQQAVDKYNEATAREKVTLILAEYSISGTTKTLEEYLNEQKAKGELDKVTNNGDGTITVEVDGYNIAIKESDLSIEGTVGANPIFEIATTKTDGTALTGDETQKAITINITNISEFGNNYKIEVTDEKGNKIASEAKVVGELTGQASYIINNNRNIYNKSNRKKEWNRNVCNKICHAISRRNKSIFKSNRGNRYSMVKYRQYSNNRAIITSKLLRRVNSNKI